MRFAIAIPTDAESWRVVRRAEELGFARAWFYDTQMLSADPFVAMAAAAMRTTRIRLGTGVLIPSNRIAPVAANALASLNKLAPGRIDFGIGTGFTGRRAMGLGAVKLADMEEYIRVAMALLREETVEAEVEGKQRLIRLLNPELGLINTKDPVGLYIAASGALARQFRPQGAHYLENHRGHLMFVKPEERPFVTADLIRLTTFAATEPELKERIAALADAGYDEIAIQIVPDQEHAIEDWGRLRRAFA